MSELAYLRNGDTIEFTTTVAYTAGECIMLAGMAAYAVDTFAIGDVAVFQVEGNVAAVASGTEPAGSIGSPVFWDSSANKATLLGQSAAGDFILGTLAKASAANATSFEVAINRFPQDLPASFFAGKTIEVKSDNYTVDIEDTGKILMMNADAKTFTLPATTVGLIVTMMCIVADGGALMSVSPQAADKIMGPDVAGVDNKDYQLTKATQNQYDYLQVLGGHADGYLVTRQRGTWAQEA